MNVLKTFRQAVAGILNPKDAAQLESEHVDEEVTKHLSSAKNAADSYVGDKVKELQRVAEGFVDERVEKLKAEAWMMIDMLEERLDAKLAEFEKRLDERLQKELYWKLVGLRWTLIFVLLTAVVGVVYSWITK